jgi:hypothetical protein
MGDRMIRGKGRGGIFRRTASALLATAAVFGAVSAASAEPIKVQRYDDADDYLPSAEKRNKDNIRLLLKQQEGEEIFKVASPRNVLIDVVAKMPKDADAAVVMLLGGNSVLSIVNDRLDRSFSFQPRSRDHWWTQQFATFVVDAPSDRLGKDGIQDAKWRSGVEHKTDLQAVLDEIGKRFAGPIVIFGHSNGAISLGNVASLASPRVKAYMFSSPAHNKPSTEILREVEYKAPVLLFEHTKDACPESRSRDAEQFFNALKAQTKKLIWVEGGSDPISGPCGPFAFHSFYGIEKATVERMVAEIRNAIK